jgi:soluble lytic murein transglycosylase-like protein
MNARNATLALMSLACAFGCPHVASAASPTVERVYIGASDEGVIQLSNTPQSGPCAVLLTGPAIESTATVSDDAIRKVRPGIEKYRDMVGRVADSVGVDPRLLHAIIAAESGYNSRALSNKGAMGLMQLMPATAKRYGVKNAYDPEQNLRGGARYIVDLLKQFDNDMSLAVAAYNAGENAVIRGGMRIPDYRETRAYVPRVLGFYRKLDLAST